MRLCEHDGGFSFAAYKALNTWVSLEEAQRISTALVVIGDERADYSEWRADNPDDPRKRKSKAASAGGVPTLELADYQRELDGNRQGLENVRAALRAHRTALVSNSQDGLLSSEEIDFHEAVEDVHATKVEQLEALVNELVLGEENSNPGRGA